MSSVKEHPVTLGLREVDAADVSQLALQIIEHQKSEVGGNFAYCGHCGLPVCRSSTRRAVKRGIAPMCLACSRARAGRRTTDSRVYLCAICRVPLSGDAAKNARHAAKRGTRTSCGQPACKNATRILAAKERTLPPMACVFCGHNASPQSIRNARSKGLRPLCESEACQSKARKLRAELSANVVAKPRLPCAGCGGKSEAASSRRARYFRTKGIDPTCPAYCDKCKPGRGVKPGKRSRWDHK